MEDQKLENLLNLSLDSTSEERERSLVLEEGYDSRTREWELIVKYSGDFSRPAALAERVSYLLNEYAIVWIREDRIPEFASFVEVEYVEKPKRLFFALEQAKSASCILPVQRAPFSLFGERVLIGVLDSGIDIFNADFQHADGTTRIIALWDQTWPYSEEEVRDAQPTGLPQNTYQLGRIFSQEQLNEWLRREREGENLLTQRIPGADRSGHGTAVTGIAAGNGANSAGRYRGVAAVSPLVIVKLGTPDPEGFPRTTQLMQGLDFAVRTALAMQQPISVNISFGNAYGAHNSESLVETFIDDLANYWKSVIVVGTGNEAAINGHMQLTVETGRQSQARIGVGNFEPGLNVQIWKSFVDRMEIEIAAPSGQRFLLPEQTGGALRTQMDGVTLLIYLGEPSPYSAMQEIFIDFIPGQDYVTSGIWEINFTGRKIDVGIVNLWLPGGGILGGSTGFLNPTPRGTMTIPSTARKVLSVGAYDSRRNVYADFSGQGGLGLNKPDLVAPGVDITAPNLANGYSSFTGTSMASPMAAGSAALLMEWGIVRGNDPFLYGEKVKAYLRRGAKPLPGFDEYPNPWVGYGALCVRDSLPV
ncbi:MAG: S8 family peptidase [Lachnospiraceae bacterium]